MSHLSIITISDVENGFTLKIAGTKGSPMGRTYIFSDIVSLLHFVDWYYKNKLVAGAPTT